MARAPKVPDIIEGEVVSSELLPPATPDDVTFTITCNQCRYVQQLIPRTIDEMGGLMRCPGCGIFAQVPGNLLQLLPMIRDLAGKGQLETFVREHGHEYGWLRPMLGMGN